jgi:ribosomal protein RSM22 (predicted rRNA methylase)
MPAAFAAISACMAAARDAAPDFAPNSLLDVGAGPGTALWAATDTWSSLGNARLLEASAPARQAGEQLLSALVDVEATWIGGLANETLRKQTPADLVTLAYVLDELAPPAIEPMVDMLWERTTGMLVIVEPGTPAGWQRILMARQRLLERGAYAVAPCPHHAPCPLVAPDWCHFAQRLARSRLHRLTKDGDAPFEDEKFSYFVASRQPVAAQPVRILAPPRQNKTGIAVKLCQPDGGTATRVIPKRDGVAFKVARRLDWGDALKVEV